MARAWAAAQHDTAFVTLSLSKGEAAATRVTPVTLSLSKGEAAATRVTPVTLSSSWSKRTTWKRMKMGLPTQRALGRALFSLQPVEG